VLPEDFVSLVAFNPLRTRIPINDSSAWVEHVDRIIRYTLDQKAKSTLCIFQFVEAGGQLLSALLRTLFERFIDAM